MRFRSRFALTQRACMFSAALVVAVLAGTPALAQNNPQFTGVGNLGGVDGQGRGESNLLGVSADGTTAVGDSLSPAGTEAILWTESGGLFNIGDLPGDGVSGTAVAVSSDGSVVAGTGVNNDGERQGFRWTSGGGFQTLSQLGCLSCQSAFARHMSANGLVVVGTSTEFPLFGDVNLEAVRWTGGGSGIDNLGDLSGFDNTEARGASFDGSVIVGNSADSGSGLLRAFKSLNGGSLIALADVPGAQVKSEALAVSSDGDIIVGRANTASANDDELEAVLWTGGNSGGGGSVQVLGSLGEPDSSALATNDDGSIIVGTAEITPANEAAFLWDAVNGMRNLQTVLVEEYGLGEALEGWTLRKATGVSDMNGAGEFVVVGTGDNPAGESEGFFAVLSLPACNDGIDNDSDGDIDFPADLGCLSKGDRSETDNCGDGIDNDGDGFTDFPADSGCLAADDPTERPDCSDSLDNDSDGLFDFPDDPGCRSAESTREDPACNDGIDNDGDGDIDFGDDAQCLAADDLSELDDCSDGVDNDGDGFIDFPADSDCEAADDPAEDPQCDDRVDNDGDGRIDFPEQYPGCVDLQDPVELAQCGDGVDNDADSDTDFPADSGCFDAGFANEDPVDVSLGELLVADRNSATVFRLNVATSAQTVVTQGASLTSPQGLAVGPNGEVVASDPGGLVEIRPLTAEQNRMSTGFPSSGSLPVLFTSDGNLAVIQEDALRSVRFVRLGDGPKADLLVPPGPCAGDTTPDLACFFIGFSVVEETAGTLVFGAGGNDSAGQPRWGVYRFDPVAETTTSLQQGAFEFDEWRGLALEADGTILAAGRRAFAESVYRIDPVTGNETLLATGGFGMLTDVAVDGTGRIFVADQGTCDASGGSCTGSQVVEIDSGSGSVVNTYSGGSITGPMSLAFLAAVPECNDGVDNDTDGATDFPAEAGCFGPEDDSELFACSDGIDNDGDGQIDFGVDVGCDSAQDDSERTTMWLCDNGLDDDGDGRIDFPEDLNCKRPDWNRERPKRCGLGFEGSFVVAALALWRARRRRSQTA
ncbi:MAG: hypothetical protein MJE66_11710 [Proteobacteria bacterium]|nr:hypothetical protein [Pseudomonadota bacterium]